MAQSATGVPNKTYAAIFTANATEIEQMFAWCFAHGASKVVLKCGAQGAWFAEKGCTPELVAATPVQVVDATGAGDCFDGSLLARLAAGDALKDAVQYANRCAALSTQGHGAVAPIPFARNSNQ